MTDQKMHHQYYVDSTSAADADGGAGALPITPDAAWAPASGLFTPPQPDLGAGPLIGNQGSGWFLTTGSPAGHGVGSPPAGHVKLAAVTAAAAPTTSSQTAPAQLFFATSASGTPVVSDTTPPPVSPDLDSEVSYISGITSSGTVASVAFQTWTGDVPGSDGVTTSGTISYNTVDSGASKWAPGGPSAAPSAAGSPGGTQYYYFDPSSQFTAPQMASLISGLSLWSAVANIQFSPLPAGDSTSLASLDFVSAPSGGTFEQGGSSTREAIGSTLLNNQGVGTTLTVNIDPNNGGFNLGDFNDGGSGVGVILHEEGHYLGLGHSGPYNGGANPATQQFSAYDTHQYSLMSYLGANDSTEKYSASNPNPGATNYGDSETWMPLDILAVQRLYGAAPASTTVNGVVTANPLSGGQTFGYNDNVDGTVDGVGIHSFFDFQLITNPVVTLYDTGAGNTLDLSGDASAETIDLRPGDYSSFTGYVDNLAIAYGTKIDNFVGGTVGATVTANHDSDVFTFQGTGNTLDLLGVSSDYTVANPTASQVVYTQTATGNTYTANDVQSVGFVACYGRGTNIATPSGDAPIETLAIGDLVLTASGESRPARWVARRSYAPRFARRNRDVWPVLIRAGALADGVPARDLHVSPRHAMHIDGLLIPAIALLNGVSIVQPEATTEIEYFHIEFDTHDVILAEGAPSESFVDDESRMGFHNAREYFELYPNAVREPALYCAPRVTDGFEVAAIRRRIAMRAAACAEPAAAPIRGFLDIVGPRTVEGWAQDPVHPEAPVCLDIVVDGVKVAQTLANRHRDDLSSAGFGSGRHGFSVHLPMSLTRRQLETAQARRSSDQALLPRSAEAPRAA